MDFKYLVGWKKPSSLDKEDEKDSWLEKDSFSVSLWVALSVLVQLSKTNG